MKTHITSSSVVALLFATSVSLNAEIIFQDDFSGSTSADLNGSALDVTIESQTWRAQNSFYADGSIISAGSNGSAYLDYTLSAGNVYTLTTDLTVVVGSNNKNWIGFGFVQDTANLGDRHSDSNKGIAWGLHRDTDAASSDQQIFSGPRTNNLVYSGELSTATITYELILDALDAENVLFSASINGSDVVSEENLGSLSGLDIQGFGYSFAQGAVGSIGNFSLSVIPEPSSYALFGGCLGLTLVMRRR